MSETLHGLFHHLWSRDVGTDGYDKEKWKRLEAGLLNLGLRPEGVKKDWRIGLVCKPKSDTHEMRGWRCEVVDVFPTGTAGIVDPEGVLMIKAVTGRVFLEGSQLWQTG